MAVVSMIDTYTQIMHNIHSIRHILVVYMWYSPIIAVERLLSGTKIMWCTRENMVYFINTTLGI